MASSIHSVNKKCYLLPGDFTNGIEHSKWTKMKKKKKKSIKTLKMYKNLNKTSMSYKNVLSNRECPNI